jgi:hypothetical protein
MTGCQRGAYDDLSTLKGKPAWGLVRTHGSMFFLELGTRVERAAGKGSHGEWHFLVEMCEWRFETDQSTLVCSDDDQEFIDATFRTLELGIVDSAEASGPSHDLTIAFSTGIRLRTFFASAAATGEWINWIFFCPGDRSWRAYGGIEPALSAPSQFLEQENSKKSE